MTICENPLVSVCVQTYQHASYIRQCLDNILNQETSFEIEILLGEDASTDGTREICIEYAEQHPDTIRLFLHERKNVIFINGRPTGRYNFVHNLKAARGKYIAFCEGDDYWNDVTKLQKQVDFLESHPDYSFCYHNVRKANASGQLLDQWKLNAKRLARLDANQLFSQITVPLLATVFRRSGVAFPQQFFEVLNADRFLLSILAQHGPAAYIPTINDAIAHIHDGGIWSSLQKHNQLNANLTTYKAMIEVLDTKFHNEITNKIKSVSHELLTSHLKRFQFRKYITALRNFDQFLSNQEEAKNAGYKFHFRRLLKLDH